MKTLKVENLRMVTLEDIALRDCDEKELKEAAIGWVKAIRKDLEFWEKSMEKSNDGMIVVKGSEAVCYGLAAGKINWIKHFFNLKEEDIK